jgi:hypothetical protein
MMVPWQPFAAEADPMRSFPPCRQPRRRAWLGALAVAAGLGAGCSKEAQIEGGAVLLELSVTEGVSTPDELRVSVYDDAGTLWKDARVPDSGALKPESATRLGSVLIQPGAAQGGLRVHVRGFAAAARVADATLAIAATMRGRFALRLDGAVPDDGDGDGVPDAIDDCVAAANPAQGGCPGTTTDAGDGGADDGGGTDGATPEDDGGADSAAPDDGGSGGGDAFNCDAAGACNRGIGAACTDSLQCASTFCVDGVCCGNACVGPCRSCNQPNNDGVCQPYLPGTDPAGECTSGATCNGAGACGPPVGGAKPNGQICSTGTECVSGVCKDGVCCNNACDGACRTCETGFCADVRRRPDPPECSGTMTCNPMARCIAL